jgi:hypothetical protein
MVGIFQMPLRNVIGLSPGNPWQGGNMKLPVEVVAVTAWSYFPQSGYAQRLPPNGDADIVSFAATAADGTYALTCNGWFFRVDPLLPEFEITQRGSSYPSVWLAHVPVHIREDARRRYWIQWFRKTPLNFDETPLEWIEQRHDAEWARVGHGPLALRRVLAKYGGANGAIRRHSDIYAHSMVFSVSKGIHQRIPLLDAVMSTAGHESEAAALKYFQAIYGEELCRSDTAQLWQQVLPGEPDDPEDRWG